MNKTQSQLIKGIAILLMMFQHLFAHDANLGLCYPLFGKYEFSLIKGLFPFSLFCVDLFIFVSGYGLWVTAQNKTFTLHSQLRRVFSLMKKYWLVLIVFTAIGYLIRPDYPGNIVKFLSNFFLISCSYNYEWWFLRPYVIIILLAPLLFMLIKKYNALVILSLSFFLYLSGGVLVYFKLKDSLLLGTFITEITSLQFPFVIGSICAKEHVIKKLSNVPYSKICGGIGILASILFASINTLSVIRPIQSAFFIVCFCLFWHDRKRPFLKFMGKHSTNIWLTHSFICYYFFHDKLYGLRYPLVIFLVLLALSVLISYCIETINFSIQHIRSKVRVIRLLK